jgi:two-component system heavy metal sensor histidine kinase CusS
VLVGILVERHFVEQDLVLNCRASSNWSAIAFAQCAFAGCRRTTAASASTPLVGPPRSGRRASGAADGGCSIRSRDAAVPPRLLAPGGDRRRRGSLVWQAADGRRYRGIGGVVSTGDCRCTQAGMVAVAIDLEPPPERLHVARSASAVVAIGRSASLLSGFLGWMPWHGAGWRRCATMAAALTPDISANRLDQRLTVAAMPQELVGSGAARSTTCWRGWRSRFAACPISRPTWHTNCARRSRNLLTQTQVTLARGAQRRTSTSDVLASNARGTTSDCRAPIADMLFLAQGDHDLMVPHRETIDLADEVTSLFDFYEALAADKGLHLQASGSAVVCGDRLMLRRAIGNLLSNAVRHTPPGGWVRVRLDDAAAGEAVVSVANGGQTIAAEQLPRLFDRFWRVDRSRQHGGEGAGLGLAIARSIARAHQGDVGVTSADGVTTFELRLPAHPGT